MPGKLRSWSLPLAAAAALLVAPAPAFAGGVVDPAPIGPDQYFVGQVNGATTGATVQVACFGPVFPGETGHPMAGQTVSALPVKAPIATTVGYTGSAADSVYVGFGISSGVATPIVLSAWAVPAKIPTTLLVPCYGTGTVTFAPVPTSPTARPATVQVTFVGQP